MSHLVFKSRQVAAHYVADGLAEPEREAFELHLMTCSECVDDVETCRLLVAAVAAEGKGRRPAPRSDALRRAADQRRSAPPPAPSAAALRAATVPGWQVAAGVVVASLVGLGGGWFLRAGSLASLEDGALEVVSLGGTTRGGECTRIPLTARAQIVAARIPGAVAGAHLVASRVDGQPLEADEYSVRTQPDGSWLLALPAAQLLGQEVALELRTPGAAGEPAAREPVGCLIAARAG
jgi:anti-sigma factor RsiW